MGGSVKLYSYFRSSAAYRVRIALNLKGIAYETVSVHLVQGRRPQRGRNTARSTRRCACRRWRSTGEMLIQSPAIIEYLDETHPDPPFLPKDPIARAKVRALAEIVACDIHPLNNTSPLHYLRRAMHQEQSAIDAWYHHWVTEGFEALEALLEPGPYGCGSALTIADIFLVPQIYNARRLKVPLDRFPKITAVEAACLALPAFERARPENQPDAE